MRLLIVDSYYPEFLKNFHANDPRDAKLEYRGEWRLLMDECFGTADFYSKNLAALGHEAHELIFNDAPLQRHWAREHDFSLRESSWEFRMRRGIVPWFFRRPAPWLFDVLEAQVADYRPDVIHVQNPATFTREQIERLHRHARYVTAQIASPYPPDADFSAYDLMLSSFPHFVQRFREQGVHYQYFQLGFEPSVLTRLGPAAAQPRGAVFVGGLSTAHAERIHFFEALARLVPFDWYGYGLENLSHDSPMRALYRGPAWALDMYRVLRDARVAINHHIDVAENCANNMRLYEATGVGAMLLTDAKPNLGSIFEPGKEVAAYGDIAECAEKLRHYLKREDERKAIARAGQERTFREHTYFHRMEQYIKLVRGLG